MAGLTREHLAGAFLRGGGDGADEHGHVGHVPNALLHQREVLRAVVLGGDVNLQERDADPAQVIIVAIGRVTDEQLALRMIVFQPIFKGSAHEATSNNSNVNHCIIMFKVYC